LVSERNEDAPEGFKRLWRDKLTVVCAPDYTVNGKPIKVAEDMRGAALIHVLGRTAYWQSFADHFGLTNWNLASGAQTNSLNVALELAANKQGCAILPRSLLENYLERNLLIEPLTVKLDSPWSCYVTNVRGTGNRPAHLFHAFLLAQAEG
jgi:LysR family glycine cleavage system transcriptional activator